MLAVKPKDQTNNSSVLFCGSDLIEAFGEKTVRFYEFIYESL